MLSGQERRRLAELEAALRRESPELAAELDGFGRGLLLRWFAASVAGLSIGVAFMLVGVSWWVGLFGAALALICAWQACGLARRLGRHRWWPPADRRRDCGGGDGWQAWSG